MESFSYIVKLLDGRLVLGAKEEVGDNLFIIPVYKIKISFLNLKTDIKSNNGDGVSGNISVMPICLLKIYNNNLELIKLSEANIKEDILPSFLNNIDINNILKNFKMN